MNIGDKINLAIGYLNDYNGLEKENLHVFNDIKIDKHTNGNWFETEKIKVTPVNYSGFYISPATRFTIDSFKPGLIDFDQCNNCYIMFSKTIKGEELLKDFIKMYIADLRDEIERKENLLLSLHKELNNLENFILVKELEK